VNSYNSYVVNVHQDLRTINKASVTKGNFKKYKFLFIVNNGNTIVNPLRTLTNIGLLEKALIIDFSEIGI
jgi:hypothetical protein